MLARERKIETLSFYKSRNKLTEYETTTMYPRTLDLHIFWMSPHKKHEYKVPQHAYISLIVCVYLSH